MIQNLDFRKEKSSDANWNTMHIYFQRGSFCMKQEKLDGDRRVMWAESDGLTKMKHYSI